MELPALERLPPPSGALAEIAFYHRHESKWRLLYYSVLSHLTSTEPHLLAVEVDPELSRLLTMQREVRRDAYRMKAFVRFVPHRRRRTITPPVMSAARRRRRYWKGVPESRLITTLAHAVRARGGEFIESRQLMAALPMASGWLRI